MVNNDKVKHKFKSLIKQRIKQLSLSSDICVFSLYNPNHPDEGPMDKQIFEANNNDNDTALPDNLDFNGIGVWYICWRHGDTFTVRHILLKSENGEFTHQQSSVFEGFWEDWPQYVADDKWVHAHMMKNKPTINRQNIAS